VANPPEEVTYFVTKAQQVAILCSSPAVNLANSVTQSLKKSGISIPYIEIGATLSNVPKSLTNDVVISSDRYQDDNSAGVVIFTSGTTGRPKGSVLRRAYTHESALVVADSFDIGPTDVLLHTLPVHHATGVGTSFFPFLNAGACIEFRTGRFDPEWVWNRFRGGSITVFSGVPTMYMRLMWHFQKEISHLPAEERFAFTEGVRRLRACLCGSSALQQPVQDFWTDVRGGQPILVRYGSSEIPGCIRVPARANRTSIPKGCVGAAAPGVDVKISDDGELLIKSPHMFSK
jgi:malonyl-CoA/methylmalonyl-CoA synthetase